MNYLHRLLCRSGNWRTKLEKRLPWVLSGAELGHHVLELGPGPGLTTDILRHETVRLTALEIDEGLAARLGSRLRTTNVEVVTGDATAMPFPDRHFTAVVSLTMLHHVPSRELQDRAIREVYRVLAPGGSFVGCDSLQSFAMRVLHIGDTLVPVDPEDFAPRLEEAGFEVVSIEKRPQVFRFHARRPERTRKSWSSASLVGAGRHA